MGGVESHNEVVVDTRSVEANLPRVVRGFFYRNDDAQARWARQKFLEFYSLERDQVPLLHLDFWADSQDETRRVFQDRG